MYAYIQPDSSEVNQFRLKYVDLARVRPVKTELNRLSPNQTSLDQIGLIDQTSLGLL